MFDETMVGYCGLDCSICKRAHEKENPCLGCKGPEENKYEYCRTQCEIMQCDRLKEKGYAFCIECDRFPCAGVMEKENRYAVKYVWTESPIANLQAIRSKGLSAFLARQRKRWTCKKCGGIISVHTGICNGCQRKVTPGMSREEHE
ncbi:MAG: DUF3795 domain-containing protein [Erysipelotrichaceae bacterium]|nr:DUF3795 domain-containing protein [Erysipelotrichaceae bacterium]